MLGMLFALAACAAAGPVFAQPETACGQDVKNKIVAALADASSLPDSQQLALQASLYKQFQSCGTTDAKNFPPSDLFFAAVKACGGEVTRRGSLYYEEMACCAYDPQRRSFGCPITVKQPFGFGPSPLPGSREYVLNCVQDSSGVFQPVGQDSVHLSDSSGVPTWQFAVIANAVTSLSLVQPMSGATRLARSILSWEFRPTNCNYVPIWGDAIDYRIRLDQ
jgi:hypothetical protein